MTRCILAMTLALGLALGACGKYGPPVRSAPQQGAEVILDDAGPEATSPEAPPRQRELDEEER
jgi:hypothetical protein